MLQPPSFAQRQALKLGKRIIVCINKDLSGARSLDEASFQPFRARWTSPPLDQTGSGAFSFSAISRLIFGSFGHKVLDTTFDLFGCLGADDEACDFPVAAALGGPGCCFSFQLTCHQ